MPGYIHSIQTLGTVDGPGIRFVVFFQGCNLRCSCCHNPDTWQPGMGTLIDAESLVKKAVRYKEYFGNDGGITLSGGEPLIQAEFASEIFELCHKNGINTCLDTSGSILDEKVKRLLEHTDRVLLDIKYTNKSKYLKHVGCSIDKPLEFLAYLNEKSIPTTIRQVIIPTVNDNYGNLNKIADIIHRHPCIDKTELLPFKKLCLPKYQNLGIDFPFKDMETPTQTKMKDLSDYLDRYLKQYNKEL